ncbi:hypothetical protein LCGC14_0395250 [marine sediment metagenome]|uniref:Primase C-terminal 2 domain-containing protein n=1 Tax=marine sediment metagenome TaxID=412755 RepID=A0A0F9SYC4_9ZZZZ
MRELPDWIDGWMQYMKNSEAPQLYNKWVAISMIAAVLERKVWLRWDKEIYVNFFIILAGPPAGGKGTAMEPGRLMLEEMSINIAADCSSKEQLVVRLKEPTTNFEYPPRSNIIHPYSAMTVFSEEFTVFLGYGNIDLIGWLSNWYDCRDPWNYETKHQGKAHIDGLWVNLIGATTPDLLRDALPTETFGSGLNSRIIYVYAPGRGKLIVFPHKKTGQPELWNKLNIDLQNIKLEVGAYTPSESYEKVWGEWYPLQRQHPFTQDSYMIHYAGRRATHIHKLSMIMNASRNGGMILTDEDFKRALKILITTERHMKRTFAGMGKNKFAATMYKIGEVIRMRGSIQYSELLEKFYYDADNNEMSTILATLEVAGKIKWEYGESRKLKEAMIIWNKKEEADESTPSI